MISTDRRNEYIKRHYIKKKCLFCQTVMPPRDNRIKFCDSRCAAMYFHKNRTQDQTQRCYGNRKRKTIDWAPVQEFYDAGNPWAKCQKKFGFSWDAYGSALKRGDIHSRTIKEGVELHHQKFGAHKLTQKTKDTLSKLRTDFLKEHPDQVPYKLNHYSKGDSYPEKYFKELIKNESIPLKFHKMVSIYELDFYNDDKKVVVEVDGEQHYCDKRIVASDIKRTNYLVGLGWRVYRVRWSKYQKKSYEDKQKVIAEIKKLLGM